MQGAGGLRCGGYHWGGLEGFQGVQNHIRGVLNTALPLQLSKLIQGRVHCCFNILQNRKKEEVSQTKTDVPKDPISTK